MLKTKSSCFGHSCLPSWLWPYRCSSNRCRHGRCPRSFTTPCVHTERRSRSWSYVCAAGQRHVCSTSTRIWASFLLVSVTAGISWQ